MPPNKKRNSRKRSREPPAPKTSLSQEEQDKIFECFDNFDGDKEEAISVKEVKRALRMLGVEVKRAEIRSWVHADDEEEVSNETMVDRNAFFRMACERVEQQQIAEKAFDLIDTSQKGVIVLDDLQRVAIELGEDLSEDDLQEMLEEVDRNGEGLVDKDDFFRLAHMTLMEKPSLRVGPSRLQVGADEVPPEITTQASSRSIQTEKLAVDDVGVEHWTLSPEQNLVQVFPGSQLSSKDSSLPPQAPNKPPLVPSEMMPLVILGSNKAGTSSIVQKFLTRTVEDGVRNESVEDGAWSLSYHKKDISYWKENGQTRCVRVQIWDIHGLKPSTGVNHHHCHDEVSSLLSKAATIILVVSIEGGSQEMIDEVKKWMGWFEEVAVAVDTPKVLFVSKCDLLPELGIHPTDWIHLGSQLERMCSFVGIQEFKLVSCVLESSLLSVEDAIMEVITSFDDRTQDQETDTGDGVVLGITQ